jgi:hypothetical protein
MLTRTSEGLRIDAVHTRAICDEIGDRLRDMLRRQFSNELPPRLRDLMAQLEKLDETLPSIVPSLDDMMMRQGPTARSRDDRSIDVGECVGAISSR